MLVFWGSFAYDMYADRFLICGGGKEEPVLKKLSVCVLFGGVSSEHEVSLRSAESVLNRLDKDKYHIFPVGITKDGDWILFGGKDYGMLPAGTWQNCEDNRRAALSPVRGQGLLSFENDCVVRERIDVVFPVMHGENCEDGAIQGLLQIAGIPYVGPHVAASAACMDKTITKLIADAAGVFFVVRLEAVGTADDLLISLVGDAVLDDDDHGLVHLVGHDLADASLAGSRSYFSHCLLPPQRPSCFSRMTVRTRAMSRRVAEMRVGLSR